MLLGIIIHLKKTCKNANLLYIHTLTHTKSFIYQIKCVDLPVIPLCVTGVAGVGADDGNTGRVQLKTSAVFMSGKTSVFIFKWKLTICDNDL